MSNGPIYVWLDDDGETYILGEQDFPGAPPVAARTVVVVETRAEAIRIRDQMLAGLPPDNLGNAITGTSACTRDLDPACPRLGLLDA